MKCFYLCFVNVARTMDANPRYKPLKHLLCFIIVQEDYITHKYSV